MSTVPRTSAGAGVDYPDSDGKPVAETPLHRDNLLSLVHVIRHHLAADPNTYVSGNMFLYYVPGDKRRHVSPDVFVARGVPPESDPGRRVYLTWREGKGPDLVIEVTSPSTRREDLKHKFALYRDTLRVREYFLFDPYGDYLDPPLRGYRLVEGQYVEIEPVDGRLPSEVTGLHLEGGEPMLRLYVPETRRWLPTAFEMFEEGEAARQDAEAALRQAEAARQDAEAARQDAEAARQDAEVAFERSEAIRRQEAAENERLRLELEDLRRRLAGP